MSEEQNEIDQSISLEDDTMDSSEEEKVTVLGNREIATKKGDPEITSLHDDWIHGNLDLQPDYQRKAVLTNKDGLKSRMIESIIMGIPIPTIYLSQDKGEKDSVIDGQQRLRTFFDFIDGKFALKDLRVHDDLNGKKFADLDKEIQRRIKKYNLHVITFLKSSESELKFSIFERLNSGATSLNHQEMRNCIYRGKYNDLLRELAEGSKFQKVMGISKPHDRMLDIEYVLRFAAFFNQSYHNYSAPMKKFLNSEMEERQQISESNEKKLRQGFKNAIDSIYSIFGENAFRRWILDGNEENTHQDSQRFSVSMYDILMWSLARADRNKVTRHSDAIKEGLIYLMTSDKEFIKAVTFWTSNKDTVDIRFRKWDEMLNKILSEEKQPRCFSYALKEKLFAENSTCTICEQRIVNIDDAAVDHIEQYWLGGKTIPENARLTHRHCNNTRKRKE